MYTTEVQSNITSNDNNGLNIAHYRQFFIYLTIIILFFRNTNNILSYVK